MSARPDARGLLAPTRRPTIPGGGPGTVAAILDRGVAEHPGAEALVGRHDRLTFAALDDAAARTADALASLGIGEGDRVAAALPNHPDIVVAFLATMRLGAIWVGINRALAPPEQSYLLRDAEVPVLLADRATVRALGTPRDLPDLRRVLVVEPGDETTEWAGVLARSEPLRPTREVDPFAPAAIAYTSGTTGYPKGAVHSQHNLLLPGAVTAATRQYDPTLRQGVCLPLTVLNLMVLAPCVTLQLGAPLVCMDRTDPAGMAAWIRQERIATFSAVPAMVHGLLTHPEVGEDDLASLVRPGVGGADLPEAFRELYRARFGAEVTIGYGLTEAPTAVTVTDPDAPPIPGEAGTALPHVDVHVRDESGRRLPPGTVGEICVGPATTGDWAGVYTPMLGYWRRPDATVAALADGVLHTGDLGSLDAQGHLFVHDRRHDLIIRGGANVYPAEVERVLHAHPDVVACAVVGAPDEHYGEVVVGFVQPAPGATVTVDGLAAHCRDQLAAYKVPERWELVDDLPRTPMGKVRKTELRARLATG